MRFVNSLGCALVAAAAMLVSAADASAWGRSHDRIYADSFGNLVIQSPSGYKRIVVGQGHLADKLSEYESGNDPSVVYLDGQDGGYAGEGYRDCYRPPYLFRGRSHMYGFFEGEIPQAPCAGE